MNHKIMFVLDSYRFLQFLAHTTYPINDIFFPTEIHYIWVQGPLVKKTTWPIAWKPPV